MIKNKHSNVIKKIKILCIIALIAVLVFLIISSKTTLSNNIKLPNLNANINLTNKSSIINNSTFFGISKNNTEYSIHAEQILQVAENLYKLTSIQGKYYLTKDNDEYISFSSISGFADSSVNQVELINNIEIIFSKGYRMLTEKLDINFSSMQATTLLPTTITGVRGKIIANNGFILKDKEKTIEFFGPVKTILY
jgi:hypothetical protein